MSFTMSTEGDSVKSGLSEVNDKSPTDNHTDDSSQDSVDTKDEQVEKPVENNVSEKGEKPKDESTEGESEAESEGSEKKDDVDEKDKSDEKPKENTETSEEVKKENEKDAKSEEDDDGEDEEEEEEKEKPKKEGKSPKKEEKPKKGAKKSKENDEKVSTASEKDEEEDAEDEEEEEEEEVEDKKKKKKGVPLLDQPLETSGKREWKNVERFEEPDIKKESKAKIEFEEGKGIALGEIPRVEASLSRFRPDELKPLHRILFRAVTSKANFKKNIKKFNGFSFDKDSDDYKKKLDFIKKQCETKHLKTICDILDLAKTGTKDELIERIVDFLMEPKELKKSVTGGTGRPKRASAVRANNRGYSSHDDYSSDEKHASRARRDKGKRANLKEESSSEDEFKPGNASDGSDEKPRAVGKRKRGRPKKGSSEEDEVSVSGGSSDESVDAPKSKRRKSVAKTPSKAKAKTPAKKGRPSRGAAAATPRSAPKRGRKAKDVSSDEEEEEEEKADDGSSSEDEPLAKKKSKSSEPPTDDEIKTFIKSVLEGANLEEITMKTVCQRVYDNYPDFDLTSRKNFIKSTVRSLIST